ncbi:hypothetical protein E4T50_14172 [Aureobasidium sp. EXF-12298]|nr:hypothetical protein E4T50_14172 [Aureobasidium sp. EXF-12298]KAI4752611.1 hypothetical protein E4T51_14228 [Aureobasidium sp. EXF-12344]KAI4769756.1 hypothetical protein E4T52_15204 [Aureobasidium sp. EXF-3400]
MAAVQLNFTLRTSSNCKTVHLIGSWDSYKSQLPLSKDSAKQGGWKGTFRFQGSTLKPGSRYWYYYIIDGYHVSHDPARESTTEPTTGRKLNILDIPSGKSSAPAAAPAPSLKSHSSHSSSKHTRRTSEHIPKGRSLSPSQIKCPRPNRPHETRAITREQYNASSVDRLANRLGNAQLESDSEDSDSDSDSDVPSLTSSRSSASSSPSSTSATSRSSSTSACTCNRYGITRSGARVKLDCGGDVCGYDEGSDCSSESEDEKQYRARTTRRQGMIVRR